jgi:hypothetical protein
MKKRYYWFICGVLAIVLLVITLFTTKRKGVNKKASDTITTAKNTSSNKLIDKIKTIDSLNNQQYIKKHGRYKGNDPRMKALDSMVNRTDSIIHRRK